MDRSKAKQRVPNEWAQIISSVHFIIKKTKKSISNEKTFKFRDDTLLQADELEKNTVLKVHEINVNELDNYMLAVDSPDSTLKFFHIYQEDWSEEVAKKMGRLYEGYLIVHMSRVIPSDKCMEHAQMIAIKAKPVLKECLEYFGAKRNCSVTMLKENEFLIKKPNKECVFLYFSPDLPSLSDEFSISNEYFSSIEKNLLNQKNFPLLDNLKLSLMIEKDIPKRVQKDKFSLVVLCEKLAQIPAKVLSCLVRVASCENVSVSIMSTDETAEISKKLLCSKDDKLLVYNTDGMVFKP
jgi:hypothetical protein